MSRRVEFWNGVQAELPLLLGVLPFGLIYGVAANAAGIGPWLAQGMSSVIFAGSAQFVTAQLIGANAPALLVIATGAVVNLRHVLYSASLAPFFQRLTWGWKILLSYLLTDEAYAVAVTHYARAETPLEHKHWFTLGAGLTLWGGWQASTGLGIFVGGQIPAEWSLDFALPLTFIALVVPALRDGPLVVAALAGGAVALLTTAFPLKLGLFVAALAGIAAGMAAEYRARRTGPPK